jgi:hypothetical protein
MEIGRQKIVRNYALPVILTLSERGEPRGKDLGSSRVGHGQNDTGGVSPE